MYNPLIILLLRINYHFERFLDATPSQVESEVSENATAGKEGAAHAGEEMPVDTVGGAVGLRHVIGLFDQLTVDFISEQPQILACL